MTSIIRFSFCFCLAFVVCQICEAGKRLPAGLKPGKSPGPYTSLVSVGAERGTSHCYICESVEKPVVIVFARSLSDPLGKLIRKVDEAVIKNKEVDLRAWVTFLQDDQDGFDPKLVAWAKQQAIRKVPLGIYPDTVGPPTYLLSREADVTVILSVKDNVVASFAFREKELNDKTIAEIMKAVPKITKGEK
jgi:hypothetical protein